MNERRAIIAEFGFRGHHPDYAGRILDAWWERRPGDASLNFVVSDGFVRHHGDVADRLLAAGPCGVTTEVLDRATETQIAETIAPLAIPMAWARPPGPPPNSLSGILWRIGQDFALRAGAQHVLFMEIDKILPALAAHCETEARVSGILFRAPIVDAGAAPEWKRWSLHTRSLLMRALSHPRIGKILCLDPRVVSEPWATPYASKLATLVDPVTVHARRQDPDTKRAVRRLLGVPDGRIVALHFGQMSERKNLTALLLSMRNMPRDSRERLSLLLYGPRVHSETPDLEDNIERLRVSGVHVVWADSFVTDAFARDLFEASDFVTAIYRDHVGMSGVVLRAAASGKPVIVDAQGLVGSLVERYKLGLCVNSEALSATTAALAEVIDRGVAGFDAESARAFARLHEPSRFGDTILRTLFEESE